MNLKITYFTCGLRGLILLTLSLCVSALYAQRLSVPLSTSQESTTSDSTSLSPTNATSTAFAPALSDPQSPPTNLSLDSASAQKPLISTDTSSTPSSLPMLRNPAVAQLPFTVAYDAFAVPVRWSLRMIHPQPTADLPPISGDTAGLLSRLPIQNVVPSKQIMIGATPIRLHGTFILKDGNNSMKVKVEQITPTDITFTTGRDFTLYRYLIPSEVASPLMPANPNLSH